MKNPGLTKTMLDYQDKTMKQKMVVRFLSMVFLTLLFSGFGTMAAEDKSPVVILAVMPFRSVGDSVSLNLGSAFSETLTTKLVGLRGLKVYERAQFDKVTSELSVQRDSADLFDQATVSKTGSVVSMDYMVVGSVTLAGKQLACQLRLVRVRDGQGILSRQFTGKYPGDLFAMQDSIAQQVVETLRLNLDELDKRRLTRQPTKSLDSWELYNKSLGNLGTAERISLLEKALGADPSFIQAGHLLADLYTGSDRPLDARRVYANILASDPSDFRALYNSALLSFDQGDLRNSRDLMEQCADRKDGDADVFYHLGLFSEFDETGNRLGESAPVAEAYEWYTRALACDALHRESLEGTGMLGLVLAQGTSDPAEQLAYLETSESTLEQFLLLEPDSPAAAEIEGALAQIKGLIPQIRDYLAKRTQS